MLSNLYVKNLALIEECDIALQSGLNILSGETGAGKSILLGSIQLALGAKADKDFIRTGSDFGLVELQFEQLDDSIEDLLMKMDLPIEEDHSVLIQRKITPTRSTCKVNGESVTSKQVKEIAELLINIHGQHEHQSLLKQSKHREILDLYIGGEAKLLIEEITTQYKEYHRLLEEYQGNNLDENDRIRELDFLNFEINEIEEADLIIGEDDEIEELYKNLKNSEEIKKILNNTVELLNFDYSAGANISKALGGLKQISQFDTSLMDLESMLLDIENLTNEYLGSVQHKLNDMEYDDEKFYQIEKRLNEINHLKDKYANTIEGILQYKATKEKRILELENYDKYLLNLKNECSQVFNELNLKCETLSTLRKKSALQLQDILIKALMNLNFLEVNFLIEFTKTKEPTPTGFDDICFMISTNPGESVKPLFNVASGGELSRIMLAIKSTLATKDATNTLIFDEIDAGISGVTAWKVSEELGKIAKNHQIICITHLPQIAAMADYHMLIEKKVIESETKTFIQPLDEEKSLLELARLLGGDELDQLAIEHGKSMRLQAKKHK